MLSVFDSLRLSGQALSVQKTRLDVASANLANAQTTRTEDGGPYRRRDVVIHDEVARGRFDFFLDDAMNSVRSVRVDGVSEDTAPPRLVHRPDHPDADASGYVAMPNINTIEEMVNMITTMRSYQANLNVTSGIRQMAERSLSIGRSV